MKTYYFSAKNTMLKSVVGLLGLTAVSCGSYQNTSYYDNDGIYGSKKEVTETKTKEIVVTDNSSANKYKDYFSANANKYSNEDDQIFTDVENYTSTNDTIENKSNENYSSWGSNDRDITVNIYGSNWGYNYWNWRNYWGYSPYHFGFSYWNDWYSPYWGYSGYYGPSWGWGWNSPYYYGGYYGYNNWYGNHYSYADGRRGITRNYSDGYNSSNRVNSNKNFETGGRRNSSTISTPRNYSPKNNNASDIRGNYPRRRSSEQNSSPRTSSEPRTSEPRRSESRRSESPRSYDTPRPSSYDSSPRSSSGSSSGSGSYGGGGRTGGRRG